jgi:hypothetical protein
MCVNEGGQVATWTVQVGGCCLLWVLQAVLTSMHIGMHVLPCAYCHYSCGCAAGPAMASLRLQLCDIANCIQSHVHLVRARGTHVMACAPARAKAWEAADSFVGASLSTA